MNGLKDAVVLVTGGGSGLGRALVKRFIAEGARVGVLESSAARAETLRTDFGLAVEVTVGDVTLYADNALAVERTVARFGRLDTFIANAGISTSSSPCPSTRGIGWARRSTSCSRSTSRVACSAREPRYRNW